MWRDVRNVFLNAPPKASASMCVKWESLLSPPEQMACIFDVWWPLMGQLWRKKAEASRQSGLWKLKEELELGEMYWDHPADDDVNKGHVFFAQPCLFITYDQLTNMGESWKPWRQSETTKIKGIWRLFKWIEIIANRICKEIVSPVMLSKWQSARDI